MKSRWPYLVCALAMTWACDSSRPDQRTVNPARTVVDAGDDGGRGVIETTVEVPTTGAAMSSVATSETSERPQPVEAGSPHPLDAGRPRSVYWGLQPGSPGADAGVAEQTLARLEVMALGSRIMTHVSSGDADDFVDIARAPDLDWIVTLPSEAFIAMDDADFAAWLDRVWHWGDAIRFLILGQHLEVDLGAMGSAERAMVVKRFEFALKSAKTHAAKPSSATVGLGAGRYAHGLTALVAASDVVALSYSGIEPSGRVAPPNDAIRELQDSVEQWSESGLSVILQDLAYPSARDENEQRVFFASIKDWFSGSDAPDVRAVVVSSLNPPAAADCEQWADAWKIDSGAEVRRSVGMRTPDGDSKPALSEVLELLAQFAQL